MTLAFAHLRSERPKMIVISKVIGTLSLNESVLDKLGQMCISRALWHLNAFEYEGYREINYHLQFNVVFSKSFIL